VAAGNASENTANTTPCNQQKVICVGATGFSGTRTPYSNFGAEVDVMAPGGDMTVDLKGNGYPDGVLSTERDAQNRPSFGLKEGTSMAAPHVTGLVALMKSVRAGLTFTDAKSLLKQTANAQFKCNEGCGAGLVNAHAAVLAAKGQAPTGNPKLALSATDLYFAGSGQSTVTINNAGGADLRVSVAAGGAAGSKLSFPAGSTYTVPPGKSANLLIAANASGLPQGISLATVSVTSNGGNATITVRINVGAAAANKEAVLAIVYQDSQGKWQAAGGGKVLPSSNYQYSFQVDPGTYYVVAAVDERGNGQFFEPGDRVGFYKSIDGIVPVTATAWQTTSGIDFALIPFKSVSDRPTLVVGSACTANSDCPDSGVCLTAPGGYCSRDCASQACPAGSKCYNLANNTLYCLANCPGPRQGRSSCRTGYVCESDGTGLGACIPACTSNADCAPSTCNTATGYCN
jgi:serine protease